MSGGATDAETAHDLDLGMALREQPSGLHAADFQGHEIPPREQQTPEALAAHHKADIETWWPIIKAANIKPE